MVGLIDSFKKVFENKKASVVVLVLVICWEILSTMIDTFLGQPNTYRQNIADIAFSILFGLYSLQFLHDAIHFDGALPEFKNINWKSLFGLIALNIAWGLYFIIPTAVLCLLSYILTHQLIFTAIIAIAVLFISIFVYYYFLAFADDFSLSELFNIKYLFKFIKVSAKETYAKLGMALLFSILGLAICVILLFLGELIGIAQIGQINDDLSLWNSIVSLLMGYFIIIIWVFAYPHSLVSTYKEKIKPIIRKSEIIEENNEN
jgi:hypothetical protein